MPPFPGTRPSLAPRRKRAHRTGGRRPGGRGRLHGQRPQIVLPAAAAARPEGDQQPGRDDGGQARDVPPANAVQEGGISISAHAAIRAERAELAPLVFAAVPNLYDLMVMLDPD